MKKMSIVEICLFIGSIFAVGLLANLATSEKPALAKEGVIALTAHNTVALAVPIFDDSAKDVQLALMRRDAQLKRGEPIYLVLDSPGGSISAGNLIIETAKSLNRPVHTVTLFSASMSFVISQHLDKRYVVPSGQMMSHRAYIGGLEGQVPGNAVTRLNALIADLDAIDSRIIKRSGYSLEAYRAMVADELWMGSESAIKMRFADEETLVSCDKTLFDTIRTERFSLWGLEIEMDFSNCPTVRYPTAIRVSLPAGADEKQRRAKLLAERALTNFYANKRASYSQFITLLGLSL